MKNRNKGLKLLIVISVFLLLTGCGGRNDKNESKEEVKGEIAESVEEPVEVERTDAEELTVLDDVAIENADVNNSDEQKVTLEDGVYVAEFNSDSSMFHVNEANEGKGILTVKDGVMTMHISLTSKNIVNLFPGLAEDAMKDGAVLLEPTIDSVTYSDGLTEEVHGFDIPVPALEEEFDLALIGKKEKWYDHKVSVNNPVAGDDLHAASTVVEEEVELEDGEFLVDITLEGGSGKATIESPAKMVVKDGVSIVTITWSSPNYDYMLLDGVKYEPVNTEGNSVFELPISQFGSPINVIGDTTAMSKPHEVEYTITCNIK